MTMKNWQLRFLMLGSCLRTVVAFTSSLLLALNEAGAGAPETALGNPSAFHPSVNWEQLASSALPNPVSDAHTAVWTGSEMIICGHRYGTPLNTGNRYDPVSDNWRAVSSTGAPSARKRNTAVWTGTEMIIWGGESIHYSGVHLNDGGRYNASTDSWVALGTNQVPSARSYHLAVWTGSEMIIWGGGVDCCGYDSRLVDGSRYNAGSDTWVSLPTNGAPSARSFATAIWTGREMIIWGGYRQEPFGAVQYLNDGARYDPSVNLWTAISTNRAPRVYDGHTAVWTGTDMIVWSGKENGFDGFEGGGRYNPAANSWSQINTLTAPSRSFGHIAVWSGNEMIVWGGSALTNNGARYNPTMGSWSRLPTNDSPTPYIGASGVWSGSEMIVWGGIAPTGARLNEGKRYHPTSNIWTTIKPTKFPGHSSHTAVWTGNEIIAWGGLSTGDVESRDGGRYNPAEDTWEAISMIDAPVRREAHTAVWTGDQMLIWGGYGDSRWLNDGGVYTPTFDEWEPITPVGAPSVRQGHTAVWTGKEMLVWGGRSYLGNLNDGGRYDPAQGVWKAIHPSGASNERSAHTVVWTGNEMIVWGGYEFGLSQSGSRYNPMNDEWSSVTTNGAPGARAGHSAVWTGREMIIWGGIFIDAQGVAHYLNDGSRYNPTADLWTPISTNNAPPKRISHTAVWTGGEMIVWGGRILSNSVWIDLSHGGRYDPNNDRWTEIRIDGGPQARNGHSAIWTGTEMIIWGGIDRAIYGGHLADTWSFLPVPPSMSIARDADQLSIAWPYPSSRFGLEQTAFGS